MPIPIDTEQLVPSQARQVEPSSRATTMGPRVPQTWAETFMQIAHTVKLRSKDPNTQTGAVLVAPDNRVLSLGYNGAPNGFADDRFPWTRHADDPLDTKYPYVIHAERNAVLNFRGSLRELAGATAYVTHFPCNECAKELIQAGVAHVIYGEPYVTGPGLTEASERMFAECGVSFELASAATLTGGASPLDSHK